MANTITKTARFMRALQSNTSDALPKRDFNGAGVLPVPLAPVECSLYANSGHSGQRGLRPAGRPSEEHSGPRQNDLELAKLHRQIGSQKEFDHEFRCDRCHAFA